MFKHLYLGKGQASLIGLLLAVILGLFLYFWLLRSQPQGISIKSIDQPTADAAKAFDIDTSSQMSTHQSTIGQIDKINKRNESRGQELMQEIGDMQKY